jgi:hypothetical protein
MYTAVPELQNSWLTQFERAAVYYLRWNRMIQTKLSGREHLLLKIEDASVKLSEFIGRPAPTIPQDENTFFRPNMKKFTLDDIASKFIRSDLVGYAKELGYTI